MRRERLDITPEEAGTLPGLFRQRILKTPNHVAYRHYDTVTAGWQDTTWEEMGNATARWQAALLGEGLKAGDKVGIMMPNCREWVMFDQATLGLGLINVPLFYNDRGGNVSYIAADADMRLLFIQGEEQWKSLEPFLAELTSVKKLISLQPISDSRGESRLSLAADWLSSHSGGEFQINGDMDPDGLATIVYTSGTTGQPKGVMLSHNNILCNTYDSLMTTNAGSGDIMLSFLPLSHMLERTAGYYLAMLGDMTVAYARSVPQLAEDLVAIRPTVLISVPRIYERVYARIQEGLAAKPKLVRKLFKLAVDVGWKRFLHQQQRGEWSASLLLWPLLEKLVAGKVTEKLGGRLQIAISGGAPLPPEIARVFLALGVPLVQGYGLTESSPVLAVNQVGDNIPESVGKALARVELRIGAESELLARGCAIMLGFWNRAEETARVIDAEGWLHTGDIARIDDQGYLYITGRLKDIIVLANGEKVSPADMELAIAMDPLIEQVMVIGEGRPFLSALVVPEQGQWKTLLSDLRLNAGSNSVYRDAGVVGILLQRISEQLREFPGYAQIRAVALLSEPWSVENGLLTPTLKIKRNQIIEHYENEVERLYLGH
ncbi:MAG: long-chain fatty acid--CoA ligase [Chromatiaceae bacterium]|nr:long-chain fatty acid--CoA ligase [Chromatiaceae bacterium]MCP5408495.1 long-chain fatty acid--CoA ligase [Chromatiaceae bacterium]MCP5444870.1 long-chain fatty acid--CoA ligase [Chromatiaceae bacterium]